MDRAHLDWLRYKAEAALNAMLTDQDRWAIMQELLDAHLAQQRTKTPEQIAAEERAEWAAKRPRFNPRYLAIMEEASRAAGKGDGRQDDR